MEDPSSTFRCISDAREQSKLDELSASDTLLLGRVTDDIDTTLTPPGTQYDATPNNPERWNPRRNAGIASLCNPPQHVKYHS